MSNRDLVNAMNETTISDDMAELKDALDAFYQEATRGFTNTETMKREPDYKAKLLSIRDVARINVEIMSSLEDDNLYKQGLHEGWTQALRSIERIMAHDDAN